MSFGKQTFIKQILTEGEKYVMSLTPDLTFSEQATYDIVNNLGSMAARFIFRPIEDSGYFYFTQTVARDVTLKQQDKVRDFKFNINFFFKSNVSFSKKLLKLRWFCKISYWL